jgi:hypothetical protein
MMHDDGSQFMPVEWELEEEAKEKGREKGTFDVRGDDRERERGGGSSGFGGEK